MKNPLTIVAFFISINVFSQIDSSQFHKTDSDCIIYDTYFGKNSSFKWEGLCSKGYAHGKGKCNVFIENTLIAEISGLYNNGVPNGICILKLVNEDIYECEYIDGRMIGIGTYKTSNGDSYKGELRDLFMHGDGEMTYSNGSIFRGRFKKSNFWTGEYIGLDNKRSFFIKGELVTDETLPKISSNYKPPLNKELTEYFDEKWNRCEKSVASYYRKTSYSSDNVPKGIVKDFYISGNIMRKYHLRYVDYSDEEMNFLDAGEFLSYYENGTQYMDSKVNYRGSLFGRANYFHDNGQLKTVCNYNNYGQLDGDRVELDVLGNITTYANYDNDEIVSDKYYNITQEGLWELNYIEDFEKNIDFWKEGSEPYASLYEGNLFVDTKNNAPYIKSRYLNVDKSVQFTIYSNSAAIKKDLDKETLAGLIFDWSSQYNYAMLYVDHKNIARLIRVINGKTELMIEHKLTSPDNHSDISRFDLSINFFYSEIRFNVNGETIHTMVKWDWLGGKEYGIWLSGGKNYLVENFGSIEFFSPEQSEGFTNYVLKKVLDENSSEYDGNGSGFFISQKGYLVTNYHVIEEASVIDIQINYNGESKIFPTKIVMKDKVNDLAILKVDSKDFKLDKEIPYTINFDLKDVGTEVFTLGYPMIDIMGSEVKFTDGKISSKSGLDGDIRTYQITTPIQPGNSGGPLFNYDGDVVGIIVSTLSRENYDAENVNFALKSNLLKNLIDACPETIELSNSGKLRSASLSQKIKSFSEFVPVVLVKE
jgi:S1-C subfamily serine protease